MKILHLITFVTIYHQIIFTVKAQDNACAIFKCKNVDSPTPCPISDPPKDLIDKKFENFNEFNFEGKNYKLSDFFGVLYPSCTPPMKQEPEYFKKVTQSCLADFNRFFKIDRATFDGTGIANIFDYCELNGFYHDSKGVWVLNQTGRNVARLSQENYENVTKLCRAAYLNIKNNINNKGDKSYSGNNLGGFIFAMNKKMGEVNKELKTIQHDSDNPSSCLTQDQKSVNDKRIFGWLNPDVDSDSLKEKESTSNLDWVSLNCGQEKADENILIKNFCESIQLGAPSSITQWADDYLDIAKAGLYQSSKYVDEVFRKAALEKALKNYYQTFGGSEADPITIVTGDLNNICGNSDYQRGRKKIKEENKNTPKSIKKNDELTDQEKKDFWDACMDIKKIFKDTSGIDKDIKMTKDDQNTFLQKTHDQGEYFKLQKMSLTDLINCKRARDFSMFNTIVTTNNQVTCISDNLDFKKDRDIFDDVLNQRLAFTNKYFQHNPILTGLLDENFSPESNECNYDELRLKYKENLSKGINDLCDPSKIQSKNLIANEDLQAIVYPYFPDKTVLNCMVNHFKEQDKNYNDFKSFYKTGVWVAGLATGGMAGVLLGGVAASVDYGLGTYEISQEQNTLALQKTLMQKDADISDLYNLADRSQKLKDDQLNLNIDLAKAVFQTAIDGYKETYPNAFGLQSQRILEEVDPNTKQKVWDTLDDSAKQKYLDEWRKDGYFDSHIQINTYQNADTWLGALANNQTNLHGEEFMHAVWAADKINRKYKLSEAKAGFDLAIDSYSVIKSLKRQSWPIEYAEKLNEISNYLLRDKLRESKMLGGRDGELNPIEEKMFNGLEPYQKIFLIKSLKDQTLNEQMSNEIVTGIINYQGDSTGFDLFVSNFCQENLGSCKNTKELDPEMNKKIIENYEKAFHGQPENGYEDWGTYVKRNYQVVISLGKKIYDLNE